MVEGRPAMAPDVARVVGADDGLDGRAGKSLALDELLEVADRRQHDIDDVLADHRLDRLEELLAGLETGGRPFGEARRTDDMQSRTHVGVLGVGDDEVRAPVRAGANARKLVVETCHSSPPPCGVADYKSTARRGNGVEGCAPPAKTLGKLFRSTIGAVRAPRNCEVLMTERLRVLIIGASGVLGRAVAAELAPRHDIVTAGSKSGDIRIDIADPASIEAGLAAPARSTRSPAPRAR